MRGTRPSWSSSAGTSFRRSRTWATPARSTSKRGEPEASEEEEIATATPVGAPKPLDLLDASGAVAAHLPALGVRQRVRRGAQRIAGRDRRGLLGRRIVVVVVRVNERVLVVIGFPVVARI